MCVCWYWPRFLIHQPQVRRARAVKDLGPAQRGEVAVDAHAQRQLWFGGVQSSRDAVHAEPLLVAIVGSREEGGMAGVGVELGDDAAGRLIGKGRSCPFLGRHYQPAGATIPAHREEPLGVWRGQHPAQAQLEDVGRNEAVGQRQLLGHRRQAPHLGRGNENPRCQVGALGLDVEAARTENVVVANAL